MKYIYCTNMEIQRCDAQLKSLLFGSKPACAPRPLVNAAPEARSRTAAEGRDPPPAPRWAPLRRRSRSPCSALRHTQTRVDDFEGKHLFRVGEAEQDTAPACRCCNIITVRCCENYRAITTGSNGSSLPIADPKNLQMAVDCPSVRGQGRRPVSASRRPMAAACPRRRTDALICVTSAAASTGRDACCYNR